MLPLLGCYFLTGLMQDGERIDVTFYLMIFLEVSPQSFTHISDGIQLHVFQAFSLHVLLTLSRNNIFHACPQIISFPSLILFLLRFLKIQPYEQKNNSVNSAFHIMLRIVYLLHLRSLSLLIGIESCVIRTFYRWIQEL